MLEIISLVVGAVTRLIPMFTDYASKGRELKHEQQRLEKEIELEKLRGVNRVREIEVTSAGTLGVEEIRGMVEALKGQFPPTGDKWLDRINVSVRPVLTYWWCLVMYSVHKTVMITAFAASDMSLAQFAPIIVTDFDRAVVGSMIGFWFVDRALRKGAVS